jgi:hypothetical protein
MPITQVHTQKGLGDAGQRRLSLRKSTVNATLCECRVRTRRSGREKIS